MSGTTETLVQSQTIADWPAGWSVTLGFNQFNPALGALQSVALSTNIDLSGYVEVESLEAAPSSIGVSQSGNVSATAGSPGFLSNYAAADASGSASLSAYDGMTNFSGSSGIVLPLSATGSASGVTSAGVDLSQAIGTGMLPVSVNGDASVHFYGPANLDLVSHAVVGASVGLQQTFTPPSGGGGGYTAGAGLYGSMWWGGGGSGSYSFTNWVTTAPQTFTFADATSGWTSSLAAQQFNPSLGTLEAVNITVDADISNWAGAENLEPTAENVQTTQTVTVTLGGAANISASPTVEANQYLAGYDGVLDLAGSSGFGGAYASTSETDQTLEGAASLAAFTGNGTITLPVSTVGTSTIDGPADLEAVLRAWAGATITVSYSYLPIGVTSDSEVWDYGDGDWSIATNWLPEITPAPTADIAILQDAWVTLDAAASVHSLVIDAPNATLILDANLTTTGDIILDAGTIEFAGGTPSAADVILNGGEIIGGTVDIDATGSIAFNGGSIVADDVVLQAGSTIAGGMISPASGFVGPGNFTTLDASHQHLIASLPAGAVTTAGSTYKLTTDNSSFHAGASGQRVAIQGTSDRVYGGAGADTVFGNDGAWVKGGTSSLLFTGGMHGNSTVVGAAGASTMYGGSGGNNVLSAGKGDALIVAGGNDLIWGGSGNDTIVGGSATSTVVGAVAQRRYSRAARRCWCTAARDRWCSWVGTAAAIQCSAAAARRRCSVAAAAATS
jgi:RTX calcium-binding nonapeptide repeat (4 copies)